MIWRIGSHASRAINHFMGGLPGQSVCATIALFHGPNCVFCKVVAVMLRDPKHCEKELQD